MWWMSVEWQAVLPAWRTPAVSLSSSASLVEFGPDALVV
jgi:hypothetical protein